MLPLLLGDNRGVTDGLVGCAGVFDCRIPGVCPKESKRYPLLYIPKLMNRIKSKPDLFFAYPKTKAQISSVVSAQLIGAFVCATIYLISGSKFLACVRVMWLSSPAFARLWRRLRRQVLS